MTLSVRCAMQAMKSSATRGEPGSPTSTGGARWEPADSNFDERLGERSRGLAGRALTGPVQTVWLLYTVEVS